MSVDLERLKKLEEKLASGSFAVRSAPVAKSASEIVGQVQAKLLQTGKFVSYTYLNHVDAKAFEIDGDALVYCAPNEGQKKLLESCRAELEEALAAVAPSLKMDFKVKEKQSDPAQEKIKHAEAMFGAEKVNVKGDDQNG